MPQLPEATWAGEDILTLAAQAYGAKMNENLHEQTEMVSLIQRIATGPKLSKDLSREQARAGMLGVLDGSVHPVQAAIFLIALRMKRESDQENLGLLDAIAKATVRESVDVPELVDVSDPYDGFASQLPVTPFLPAVLSACGLPAVSHGVERMAPKFGLTHAQVLRAAGVPVELSPAEAASRMADPAVGWAYVDQSRYCPALYQLAELRRLMVKRTALSTLERIAGPLRARRRTHLLAGYVHTAYPKVYALLAREVGFDSALLVRGVEGAVAPSLRRPGQAWGYSGDGGLTHFEFTPAEAGIEQDARAVPLPEDADAPAEAAVAAALTGISALEGEPGPARDTLVYTAALCLRHVGAETSLLAATARAREALNSGAARARLEAARGDGSEMRQDPGLEGRSTAGSEKIETTGTVRQPA